LKSREIVLKSRVIFFPTRAGALFTREKHPPSREKIPVRGKTPAPFRAVQRPSRPETGQWEKPRRTRHQPGFSPPPPG
jgi:hypothetical protein